MRLNGGDNLRLHSFVITQCRVLGLKNYLSIYVFITSQLDLGLSLERRFWPTCTTLGMPVPGQPDELL